MFKKTPEENINIHCVNNSLVSVRGWVGGCLPFTALSDSQYSTKHNACMIINRWALIPVWEDMWQKIPLEFHQQNCKGMQSKTRLQQIYSIYLLVYILSAHWYFTKQHSLGRLWDSSWMAGVVRDVACWLKGHHFKSSKRLGICG